MFVRALTVLSVAALCATPALAGTVILENGQVVVGKIKQEEANEDMVIVRWPYKDFKPPMAEAGDARGEWEIPMHKVRWMDVDADGPTDLYWAEYGHLEIGDDWKSEQMRWQMRQENAEEQGDLANDTVDEAAASLITGKGEEDESEEAPAETPAEAPAETPAETPAATPAQPAAAEPAADSGSGFCSLRPAGAGGGAAWLALLGLGLLGLRRRGA